MVWLSTIDVLRDIMPIGARPWHIEAGLKVSANSNFRFSTNSRYSVRRNVRDHSVPFFLHVFDRGVKMSRAHHCAPLNSTKWHRDDVNGRMLGPPEGHASKIELVTYRGPTCSLGKFQCRLVLKK